MSFQSLTTRTTHRWRGNLAALALALLLSGCAGALSGGIGGVSSQVPGTAAGLFGIPAATISQQMISEIAGLQGVAAQFQMLRAQLDGNLPIMPTPPIINPTPTPVAPTPGPPVVINPNPPPVVINPPGGPIVTPNAFHAPRRRVVPQVTRAGGTLTPPSDLRSLFGPDGHLLPSAMVQTTGL
jgi:hypothetical protein